MNKIDDSQEFYFIALIQTAEFMLMKGDINLAEQYISQAYAMLKAIKNPNYLALFWYAKSWISKEKGDYNMVLTSVNEFFNNVQTNKNYPIHLFMLNLKAFSEFHLGDIKNSCNTAEKVYQNSHEYFQSDDSDIAAESLITLAKCDINKKSYDEAHKKILRAIDIMEIVFGNKDIDLTQAVAHSLLGEINATHGKYKKAFEEYQFAENYYTRIYQNKFPATVEIGNLFKDMALLGIKIHDRLLIKSYLTKLVALFGYESVYVKELLTKLDNSNEAIIW